MSNSRSKHPQPQYSKKKTAPHRGGVSEYELRLCTGKLPGSEPCLPLMVASLESCISGYLNLQQWIKDRPKPSEQKAMLDELHKGVESLYVAIRNLDIETEHKLKHSSINTLKELWPPLVQFRTELAEIRANIRLKKGAPGRYPLKELASVVRLLVHLNGIDTEKLSGWKCFKEIWAIVLRQLDEPYYNIYEKKYLAELKKIPMNESIYSQIQLIWLLGGGVETREHDISTHLPPKADSDEELCVFDQNSFKIAELCWQEVVNSNSLSRNERIKEILFKSAMGI